MRPTPAETAAALRRILDTWAADEAQSQHQRWMLRRATSVLAQTDWEDASASIAASNVRLLRAIETGLAWISGLDTEAAGEYDAAARAMSAARDAAVKGTASDVASGASPLEARNELQESLRGATEAFVSALEADRVVLGHGLRRRSGYACISASLDDL
ncbi:hypothetical protein CH263_22440 [Rhodococcus sp. 06-1059B-a]|nr:hypothetical protein [Rhodococcus sp. 06-1059B-a]OZD59762.1 hypothetical protein CH263_22440 [Rhodococcus sp. 06-1059B-a]